MSDQSSKKYLCIHGHFYQPPRENAWTEEIELQESASPFHDWNERIYHECYLPNAEAKILDNEGFVTDIVNNFENMSFNFGPTLMSWLEKKQPQSYRLIIEADKKSVAERRGHGNAIAQAYNHMILPLANARDKITQVIWGIKDFEYRFGRKPESMWLPETACNVESLHVLADYGLKYVILEPHQAESITKIGSNDWKDVSNGSIDPKRPYRCYLDEKYEKYIDIFFYDGPISKAVGFENLLTDAKLFMDRIESAVTNHDNEPQLINIATDGETYGHHKAFGDRVIAYLLKVEAKKRGFEIVNYAEFLEMYPPQYEVKIKAGKNNEGTSWSCPHGVDRWQANCGCRGDGPAEWTQEWRGPLRKAFDYLRDELATLYENTSEEFLKDPWAARNDYIDVILNRSQETIDAFFAKHSAKVLNSDEVTVCLKLLEMQRHLQLMYTSCAWFFTELSGLETVQVMQYSARAIEMAKQVGFEFDQSMSVVRTKYLELLSEAKSNIPEFKDGRKIYEDLVLPSVITLRKLVANTTINEMFASDNDEVIHNCFSWDFIKKRVESFGSLKLNFGRVKVSSKITLEEVDLAYIVLQFGAFEFRCSVKNYSDFRDIEEVERNLFDGLYSMQVIDLLRMIDDTFGKKYFALKDLFKADRIKIISTLTKEIIDDVTKTYMNIYTRNRMINEIYQSVNIPIPQEIYFVTEFSLNRKVIAEVALLSEKNYEISQINSVLKVLDLAKANNVNVKLEPIALFLSKDLERRTIELNDNCLEENIQACIDLVDAGLKIGIKLDFFDLNRNSQVSLDIIESQLNLFSIIKSADTTMPAFQKLIELGEKLKIKLDLKSPDLLFVD